MSSVHQSLAVIAAVTISMFVMLGGQGMTQTPETNVSDDSHGFDFLFGHWSIHNRMLRHPLSGSHEWHEFEATSTESPVLGGEGNLEQYNAPNGLHGPIHAVAMRLYDRKSGQWSIYWSTVGTGSFGVPTAGKFENGVGLFYDHEDYNGRPIVVRFTWTHSDENHCRWEQAFSADGGTTWEPNWIMEFTRSSST